MQRYKLFPTRQFHKSQQLFHILQPSLALKHIFPHELPYTLLCEFSDGVRKRVDLTPLLQNPAYRELQDEKQFIQFGLDQTIFWKNGADIAPEYLYAHGFAIA